MSVVLEGQIVQVHSDRAVVHHEKFGKLKFGPRSESTHLQHLSYKYKIGDEVVFLLEKGSQVPSLVCLARNLQTTYGLVTHLRINDGDHHPLHVVTPLGEAFGQAFILTIPPMPGHREVRAWDIVRVRAIPTSDRANMRLQIVDIMALYALGDADKQLKVIRPKSHIEQKHKAIQVFPEIPSSPPKCDLEKRSSTGNIVRVRKEDSELQLPIGRSVHASFQVGYAQAMNDSTTDDESPERPGPPVDFRELFKAGKFGARHRVDGSVPEEGETLSDQGDDIATTPHTLGSLESSDVELNGEIMIARQIPQIKAPLPILCSNCHVRTTILSEAANVPKKSGADSEGNNGPFRALTKLCLLDDEIYAMMANKYPLELRAVTKALLNGTN